jgi:CBS domain-containing protein
LHQIAPRLKKVPLRCGINKYRPALASPSGGAQHLWDRKRPADFALPQRGIAAHASNGGVAMQVRHILQHKGREVIGVADSATLGEAARTLAEHRIGAVLIQDNGGALAGIFSERDLVRAVAEDGPFALNRTITAYMSRPVTTCQESDTVEQLMEMMTSGRFRHVPVLDEKQCIAGMISIGDVVKTRIAEAMREANSLREYISAAG